MVCWVECVKNYQTTIIGKNNKSVKVIIRLISRMPGLTDVWAIVARGTVGALLDGGQRSGRRVSAGGTRSRLTTVCWAVVTARTSNVGGASGTSGTVVTWVVGVMGWRGS